MRIWIWSVDHLARVLAGDHRALRHAFHWEDTPQGDRYWYRRSRGKVPLSDKDRDYLQQLYTDAVKRRLKL